ncbi:MAG: PadR family transcriptional regulator [Candidatus Heimdallarchaeota archaeon]|nr:PadR family transcriptional regulator [Candidatus Heimdallarchaeota archaeon]
MYKGKMSKKCYPPRGRRPGFHHGRPHPPGVFRPLMSMSKESFKEMRKYFVLKILTDNPEGITGYQLQEEYHFPRTNVLRLLDILVEDKLVETKEETVEGRANKLYIITDSGIKLMEEMKEKWGERFRMMNETTMPFFTRGEKFVFMKRIDKLDNSEDAVDYFRGLRSKIKTKQSSLKKRLDIFTETRQELDAIVDMLEKDKEFDREKLVQYINDWWERKNVDSDKKQ